MKRLLARLAARFLGASIAAEINHARSQRSAETRRARRSAERWRHVAELRAAIAAQPEQDIEDDGFVTMSPWLGGAFPLNRRN